MPIKKPNKEFQPSNDQDKYILETTQYYVYLGLYVYEGVTWQVTAITVTEKGYTVEFTRKPQ